MNEFIYLTDPTLEAKCADCGKPYDDFGLDMVLSDEQWLMIFPQKNGLLCANCIVNRASKLKGSIIVKASIQVGETWQ